MAIMKVKYVGTSTYRVLQAEHLWREHGIKVTGLKPPPLGVQERVGRQLLQHGIDLRGTEDLVWGPHNNYSLTMDVSEDLENLLRGEEHFVLSKLADDGSELVVSEATSHDDHPSTVSSIVDDSPRQVSRRT